MAIINGVGRVGIRSYVAAPQQITTSTLQNALYSAWNGDTSSTELNKSIYAVWNGTGTNNQTVKNAWNANGDAVDSKSGVVGTIVTPNSTTGYTTSSMTYSTG